eukprot:761501-Hanusia_phi.AAC.3
MRSVRTGRGCGRKGKWEGILFLACSEDGRVEKDEREESQGEGGRREEGEGGGRSNGWESRGQEG